MHDIPGMTVEEHHKLCLGVLALCVEHVPDALQMSILEGLAAAVRMGVDFAPESAFGQLVQGGHNNKPVRTKEAK